MGGTFFYVPQKKKKQLMQISERKKRNHFQKKEKKIFKNHKFRDFFFFTKAIPKKNQRINKKKKTIKSSIEQKKFYLQRIQSPKEVPSKRKSKKFQNFFFVQIRKKVRENTSDKGFKGRIAGGGQSTQVFKAQKNAKIPQVYI